MHNTKKYLIGNKREVRYFNKWMIPGRVGFEGFLSRHSNKKEKYAESVGRARAAITKDWIHKWMNEIEKLFNEENCEDAFLIPDIIFNAHEAGLAQCPKSGKNLGPTKTDGIVIKGFIVKENK